MRLNKTFKRELQVAFAKDAQPVAFRIVKYLVLIAAFYFFWGSIWLWIVLGIMIIGGAILHIHYRKKTENWTKDYGLWTGKKKPPL